MTRRKIRRLYDDACKAYQEGVLEGLAGMRPMRSVYDEPYAIALHDGRAAGIEWANEKRDYSFKYANRPSLDLPTTTWALVLARAQRP